MDNTVEFTVKVSSEIDEKLSELERIQGIDRQEAMSHLIEFYLTMVDMMPSEYSKIKFDHGIKLSHSLTEKKTKKS